MVDINWGLAGGNNALANFQTGMQLGQQFRKNQREEETRNALATLTANPGDKTAAATLMQNSPELGLKWQGMQQDAATAKGKAHNEQLTQLGRLLNHARDEGTYQQSLAAAKAIGIDVSQAPANFDPNWVQQQKLVVSAFEKDGGAALSNFGKIATDMGLQPGTPEHAAKVVDLWRAEQIKTIPYSAGGAVAGYNTATGESFDIIKPEYRSGEGSASGGVQEGATATNPQTGEKIQYRGGKWVPMTGGTASNGGGNFPG